MNKFLFALLICVVLPASAGPGELRLAPGKSLTILDAGDPTVRVVLTAPAEAPLDLSALLLTGPNDSVYSIVTRMQLEAAKRLSRHADGSLALAGPRAAKESAGNLLQGGVLVFSAGKFVYHPVALPAPSAGPDGPALEGGGRLLISKPGVARAQAELDIGQCRRYADAAAAQFLRSAAKVAMYNNAMRSCLKSFGYQVHAPAA